MERANLDGQNLSDEVLRQIQDQDWSDVVQKGQGGGSDAGAWYVEYEWFRPRTEAERRLWFEGRDRQRAQR